MIKYAIFDMDGTVFDTERLMRDAWMETGRKWNLDKIGDVYIRIVGRNFETACNLLKMQYGEDFPAKKFFAERMALYFEMIKNSVPVKKGSKELLEYLRSNGIKTALATSSDLYVAKDNLKKAGFTELFDAIVAGDMVKNSKPAPDIFIEAGNRIGADPCETIVCEDAYTGIEAAVSAKMMPIFVEDMLPPIDNIVNQSFAVCSDLLEVIEIIKKENKI